MKKLSLFILTSLLCFNTLAGQGFYPKPESGPKAWNLAAAQGKLSGVSFVHKFGNAPDFDTDAGGNVVVWDGSNDALANTFAYTYSATANITQLSSSSASDTEPIEIQGLNSAYELVVQTITLTGTTAATITTPLIRVFRMKNVGTSDLVGTVYATITGAGFSPAGVPDTGSEIRAIITIGENQTLMAIYTIPAGKTGFLCSFYASTSKAVKTSAHIIRLKVKPFGQIFQTKHITSLIAAGVGHFSHIYDIPERIPAKADIEIRTDTDTNVAGVSAGFDLILIDD